MKHFRLAAVVAVAGAFAPWGVTAQQRAVVADIAAFSAHDPASPIHIDYKIIDEALKIFVVPDGPRSTVRYSAIKGDGQLYLRQVIEAMANVKPATLTRDEQLAYWLNLRLLMVLHATSGAFPDARAVISPDKRDPLFAKPQAKIAGQDFGIADIDRVVTTLWAGQPDVVFGLVEPIRSGPAFPAKAYRGNSVRAELAKAAQDYVNRSGTIKVGKEAAELPAFLVAHRGHIGVDDPAVLRWIGARAAPKLAERLATSNRIAARADWRTNAFAERSLTSFDTDLSLSAGRSGGIANAGVGS